MLFTHQTQQKVDWWLPMKCPEPDIQPLTHACLKSGPGADHRQCASISTSPQIKKEYFTTDIQTESHKQQIKYSS